VQQKKQLQLQQLSQHMHINAFANVWLGSNTYGLLEALPHSMMYAFLHGVLMYVLEVIMSPMNRSEKFKLYELWTNLLFQSDALPKHSFPDAVSLEE